MAVEINILQKGTEFGTVLNPSAYLLSPTIVLVGYHLFSDH
jgi:hypothetical protein